MRKKKYKVKERANTKQNRKTLQLVIKWVSKGDMILRLSTLSKILSE